MALWKEIIDEFYPEGTMLREVYMNHCRKVADLAMAINDRRGLGLPTELVETAAMLHDIGIFMTDAPGIHCHGTYPYIGHGYLGADLLRSRGVDECIARVCERHTGTGITREELFNEALPLPLDRCYEPQTQLEKLICYADKFFSKSGDGEKKTVDRVRKSLSRFGEGAVSRFDALHREFGDYL